MHVFVCYVRAHVSHTLTLSLQTCGEDEQHGNRFACALEDIFANHMCVKTTAHVIRVPKRGEVVHKRIQPHVHLKQQQQQQQQQRVNNNNKKKVELQPPLCSCHSLSRPLDLSTSRPLDLSTPLSTSSPLCFSLPALPAHPPPSLFPHRVVWVCGHRNAPLEV